MVSHEARTKLTIHTCQRHNFAQLTFTRFRGRGESSECRKLGAGACVGCVAVLSVICGDDNRDGLVPQ